MRVREPLAIFILTSLAIAACGWDPSKPFERDSPVVNQAIGAYDAGDATAAAQTLQGYLTTGACAQGNISTPELVRRRADGTFDLGLSLFRIGESYGRRFGEEEMDAGADTDTRQKRRAEIECALRLVRIVAADPDVPPELRARARYLEGNLLFLDAQYEEAVKAYDAAITISPGLRYDGGDPVGGDAAWNRAIALRRIEDNKKKDAGNDAAEDAPQDSPSDAPKDAQEDAPKDSGNDAEAGNDSGNDGGDGGAPDSGGDSGGDGGAGDSGGDDASKPPPQQPDGGQPPPRANQDERVLDDLDRARTVQEEDAKRRALRHPVKGSADK